MLFYGDRNHIHHLLINKFTLIKTNLFLVFLNLLPIFSIFIYRFEFFYNRDFIRFYTYFNFKII